MHRKLDWKRELDKKELKYGVLLLLLYLAAILMATAGCSRRSLAQPDHPAGNIKPKLAAAKPANSAPVLSGRRLTIENARAKKETSRHFDDDVLWRLFDFPKNYDLHEGDLPDMDRGLGYLGTIPMKFSAPGGVRLATVEVPRTAASRNGFRKRVFYRERFSECHSRAVRQIPAQPMVTARQPRAAKLTASHSARKRKARLPACTNIPARILHGYAEESCYEIGYGIATAGYGAMDGVRKVNNQAVLQKLEKILDSLTINPPQNEASGN